LYRWGSNNCWHFNKVAFFCAKKRKPITVAKELVKPCALHYYQLLFDLRRGVREKFMKAQGVRVHRKVKNHCSSTIDWRIMELERSAKIWYLWVNLPGSEGVKCNYSNPVVANQGAAAH